MFSKAAIWVVIALVLFTVFKQFDGRTLAGGATPVPYSDFLDEVKSKRIKEATIEDRTIVAPAVEKLRAEGIDARGPLPADTMFHAAARARYDAALCMYHDQALIPIKTLAFDHAVNVTLGLPFVRTSPDHGTAFDIAGTGRADPASLIAAIRLAVRLAQEQQVPAAALP